MTEDNGLKFHHIYQVDEYYAAMTATDKKKRGGPYILTTEETYYLNGWMAVTHVSDEDFEAGTGHMHLFNLAGMSSSCIILFSLGLKNSITAVEHFMTWGVMVSLQRIQMRPQT